MTEDKRQKRCRDLDASIGKSQPNHGATKKDPATVRMEDVKEEASSSNNQSPSHRTGSSTSQSPIKDVDDASNTPLSESHKQEEVVGGEVTVKQEPGQPPKLSRSTSRKILSKPPQLYNNYADKTREAEGTFQVIPECSYTSKYIGSTEQDSMDCDCAEEWGMNTFRFLFISILAYIY